MRVLLVEDEIAHRLLMQRSLRDLCQTDVAVNGQEAVAAFELAHKEGEPYDLVLLDLEMPVMDGQQALKAIRSLEKALGVPPGREVPTLVITAHDDQRNVCDAFFKGLATGYLVKPVRMADLRAHMAQLGLA
ncbi:Transcriptional activator protein CzcR [Fundidesulfovibrio magnetotacticus]|uniref:Transcriptional activator protein CzcR n=1 Tax=Fundidesulfovibrio magnetotacticus TaxID=2730080 RepID=A0A6V8LVT0_9BACT|nr:response regulator [Fundidesulfovibrio magnetotacticus]GFK93777.1 Transcriptional activator protein CzcR [Fundidesulfovibrio magnetotacticus]